MQSLIKLKVCYGSDIRRLPLVSNDFESLQKQISEIFGLEITNFYMKYKDDEEDLVTICNSEEFKEAIDNTQNILRIFVINKQNEQKKKCNRRRAKKNKSTINKQPIGENNNNMDPILICQNLFQPGGKIEGIIENVLSGNYSDTFKEFYPYIYENWNQSNTDIENKQVAHNAFCDRCDEKIVGIRWKCFDCPDFDYCDSCFQVADGKEDKKTHLKNHVFGKIEHPNTNSIFQLEKDKYLEKMRIERELKDIQEKKSIEEELRLEKERIEKEKLEKERIEKEKQEQQEKEKQEKERLEKEKIEKEKESKIVYPFEQKLQDLQNMGFVDRKKNIQLLIKHKGNMNMAIQSLLDD